MPREQRLVGRDDVLAARDRFQRKRIRRLIPTDQLDDDVDVGIANHIVEIRRYRDFRPHDRARLVDVAHRDRRDFDSAAGTPRDLVLIALQDFVGSAPYGAEAK